MYKEHTFTKISLGIDIFAVVVLIVYFFSIMPDEPITDLRGLLVLSPPIFGILGIIPAIVGQIKTKSTLAKALIIVNIIFICWWPILWYGGTLLFGV